MSAAGKPAKTSVPDQGLAKLLRKRAAMEAKAAPSRKASMAFRRADLVGKFPHVKHLAAPKGKRLLDAEERERILAAMMLD